MGAGAGGAGSARPAGPTGGMGHRSCVGGTAVAAVAARPAVGVSGNKFDVCAMAVGLSESPVAGDQRRSETFGEGDVDAVGSGVRAA